MKIVTNKIFILLFILIFYINWTFASERKKEAHTQLKKRKTYSWRVGIRDVELVVALKNGDKDYIYKNLNLNRLNNTQYSEELIDYFNDDIYYEMVDIFNVKHTCIVVGEELFEFDTDGLHRYPHVPSEDDGWNWNLLGKKYHGKTTISPDRLAKELKKREETLGGDHVFRKDTYHFLCHNCQDFVQACINILDKKFATDKYFTFRPEEFNDVVRLGMYIGKLNDPKFMEYLTTLKTLYECESEINRYRRDLISPYESAFYYKECLRKKKRLDETGENAKDEENEVFYANYTDSPCFSILEDKNNNLREEPKDSLLKSFAKSIAKNIYNYISNLFS